MDDLRAMLSNLSLADRKRLLDKEKERRAPPELLAAVEGLKPVTAESSVLTEAMEAAETEANYRMILDHVAIAKKFKNYQEEDRKVIDRDSRAGYEMLKKLGIDCNHCAPMTKA